MDDELECARLDLAYANGMRAALGMAAQGAGLLAAEAAERRSVDALRVIVGSKKIASAAR